MEDDNQNKSAPDERDGSEAERNEGLRKQFEETIKKKEERYRAYAERTDIGEDLRAAKAEIEAKLSASNRAMLISRLRPIMLFIGPLMAGASSIFLAKPEIFQLLVDNPFAAALGLSGVMILVLAVFLGLVKERTFVDIDDKLYSARVESVEAERDQLLKKLRAYESERYHNLVQNVDVVENAYAGTQFVEVELPGSEVSDSVKVADTQTFDGYMKSVIRALDMNIEIADNKASLLLDKGTTYLWRGIVFYVTSIVVWQVVTAYLKVGEFAVWGMISCSMTFLVVEFLAAWFLRQYKSFTDSSFNLVRVKSVFNRYFLSYLAIKEFADSTQHLVDMRAQMLKVLEEDIKWLEPVPQKAGELNHMIAMFESVSGLLEKLKVISKDTKPTASS